MTDLLHGLLDDLTAEGDQLRETVERLGPDGWTPPTPAPGWTVATQVAHLLWTDEVAVLAAHSHESPEAKQAWDDVVLAAIDDPIGYVDAAAFELAALPRDEALTRWAASRAALRAALTELPAGQKMPWFGPPMSAASMATARFMETWAHALDVYDAAGERYRADRPDPARRPPRRPHPQLRLLGAPGGAAGRGVPRRADRAERRALGVGARGRGASRCTRVRRTTSACSSPSGSTAPTPTWSRSARTPSTG